MSTWLLTWNQEKWGWNTDLYGYEELINDIKQVGFAYCKWTCGVNKSIKAGDRVFLIKLGQYPKGIVASGFAASGVFEGTHWDLERKLASKKARRIVVRFDKIKNYNSESFLDFQSLENISNSYCWSPQSSGVSIPDEIAEKLELEWRKV